jgi:hypothetical protein
MLRQGTVNTPSERVCKKKVLRTIQRRTKDPQNPLGGAMAGVEETG